MNQKDKGFTPTDLQKMLNAEIESTLAQVPLSNTKGEPACIKAYSQYLPIPQSTDDDDDSDLVPYVITKIQSGERSDSNPYVIQMGLIICVCNYQQDRSGHFDLLNIIQRLESRFAKNNSVGNFEVRPSFKFALQDSDTHPFYYAGVIISFNAPQTTKEVSIYA